MTMPGPLNWKITVRSRRVLMGAARIALLMSVAASPSLFGQAQTHASDRMPERVTLHHHKRVQEHQGTSHPGALFVSGDWLKSEKALRLKTVKIDGQSVTVIFADLAPHGRAREPVCPMTREKASVRHRGMTPSSPFQTPHIQSRSRCVIRCRPMCA
jgi:hypothetical protein